MVLLSTRGGVPVFNFFMLIPSFIRDSESPVAAASPSLPALYDFSPTNILPFREVPVVRIIARAEYSIPNSSTAPVILPSFAIKSVMQA